MISKFHALTDSEHKFHKARIENWLSIGFELECSWLGIRSHNHRLGNKWVEVPLLGTCCSANNGGSLKKFIYPSIKPWNNPGDISPTWKCASVLKSYWHNHATLLMIILRESSPNPGVTQGNLGFICLHHFLG